VKTIVKPIVSLPFSRARLKKTEQIDKLEVAAPESLNANVLSTVFGLIFFFSNLMYKFFILIHLLYSSTCFEHCYAHLEEDNCISTASGIVTLFR